MPTKKKGKEKTLKIRDLKTRKDAKGGGSDIPIKKDIDKSS